MDSSDAKTPLRARVAGNVSVEPEGRHFPVRMISGHMAVGARLRWLPRGQEVIVAHVRIGSASGADTISVALVDGIIPDAGDFLAEAAQPAVVADQFEATLDWLGDTPLLGGRRYLLELADQHTGVEVTAIKYRAGDSHARIAARCLNRGDVAVCNLKADRPLVFDAFADNPTMGGFAIRDDVGLLGRGRVHFALRRAHNIHRQHIDVDKRARAELKGQQPCILWLTGLSGAGKSTIANLVEKRLIAAGRHTYLLDGDNLRHGLNKDLGFTDADRVENIRRVAELAKLMIDAGLIVITAFISPFRAERRMARELVEACEFLEVFIDTPLAVAEQRDVKGLYQKARRGELKNFTGIDSPYEAPECPEIWIDTQAITAEEAADTVLEAVQARHGPGGRR